MDLEHMTLDVFRVLVAHFEVRSEKQHTRKRRTLSDDSIGRNCLFCRLSCFRYWGKSQRTCFLRYACLCIGCLLV